MISGGNFHGEYPAKAADYLAIGVTELVSTFFRFFFLFVLFLCVSAPLVRISLSTLHSVQLRINQANISERRLERLVNPTINGGR